MTDARINGVHHLAISTNNMKEQISFFSDVLGMRLVALYWMHGSENALHGFLELNERSTISFVEMPENANGRSELGSSHAAYPGAPSAGGTMEHLALRVDTRDDLIALSNRIRSHGVPVFGPVEHGMCQSIYFAGPEGLNLEVATPDSAVDPEAWIDPEVVARVGISQEELARFVDPLPSPPRAPVAPQPAYDPAKPHMKFPDDIYRNMLAAPEAWAEQISHPEPPVRNTPTLS